MARYRFLLLGLAALSLASFTAAAVIAQERSAADRDKPAAGSRDKDSTADRIVSGRIIRVNEEKRTIVLGMTTPTKDRPGADRDKETVGATTFTVPERAKITLDGKE